MAKEGGKVAASRNAWTPLVAKPPSDATDATATTLQQVSPTPSKKDSPKWPTQSATALPSLTPHLVQGLQQSSVKFPINEELTSLRFSPTGRVLVGGFTDGTVRIFDLTGRYSKRGETASVDNQKVVPSSMRIVNSKDHQIFGAVACQIHAKGVHTALRMDVDVSEDGLWCFAGALRGSMEHVAVHLGHLEASYDDAGGLADRTNLLDHLTVYRHSDAKLRGFGACLRLKNSPKAKYLLFAGKAIKNIHIWSFEPPESPGKEPIWQQLYNTQTNGTTIRLLQFRESRLGRLQAISKSDGQKLRVWDLTSEDAGTKKTSSAKNGNLAKENEPVRPSKRPPFCDVPNTESTLGVVGGFCINGGDELFNQLSIVSLDVDNLTSPFNHTELALPSTTTSGLLSTDTSQRESITADKSTSNSASSFRRRQQRGDLKSVTTVAGMVLDASHALLELSDGSIVHYQKQSGQPTLSLWEPLEQQDLSSGGIPVASVRTMSVGRVGSEGKTIAAVASYAPANGRGQIVLQALDDAAFKEQSDQSALVEGYWGCLGRVTLPYPVETGEDLMAAQPTLAPATTKSVATVSSSTAKPRVSMVTGTVKKVSTKTDSTRLLEPSSTKTPGPTSVVKRSSSSVVRCLGASTPFAVSNSKKSKDTDVAGSKARGKIKRAASHDAQLDNDSRSARKYLKSNKSVAKPAPFERPVVTEKDRAKSPPIPRKRASGSQESKAGATIQPKSTVLDAAASLCELSEMPAVTPSLVHEIVRSRPSKTPPTKSPRRTPLRSRMKDDPVMRKKILSECSKQASALRSLLNEIPNATVNSRLKLSSTLTNNLDEVQELARAKLAAEHRARHDMIRKKVLNAALQIVQSVRYTPTVAALDSAKKTVPEALGNFREILDDTIQMQQMEAHTLAAQQRSERNGGRVPCLEVSFPFPDLFEQAMACTPEL